jgi:pyridoxamine 5'-phosphate oxidase
LSSSHSYNIANTRTDYLQASLDEEKAGDNPIVFFKQWYGEATNAMVNEINAMTLATVGEDGKPHARIVLLKAVDDDGFVFFTNYHSQKGKDLETHPHAALVFFWNELERQVRIEGRVEKISEEESTAYFESRPEGSRIGAWSSPQSSIIKTRDILEENYSHFTEKFKDGNIPKPPHWGGYRVIAEKIEFWQGRSSRMHDRIQFFLENSIWKLRRLAP